MNQYEVTNIHIGKYACDTIYIKVDQDICQIPINKQAKITSDLIGKEIEIDNLFIVPLDEVILV